MCNLQEAAGRLCILSEYPSWGVDVKHACRHRHPRRCLCRAKQGAFSYFPPGMSGFPLLPVRSGPARCRLLHHSVVSRALTTLALQMLTNNSSPQTIVHCPACKIHWTRVDSTLGQLLTHWPGIGTAQDTSRSYLSTGYGIKLLTPYAVQHLITQLITTLCVPELFLFFKTGW